MSKSYSFDDLRHIIETLRSENGCPWDREQTHESLTPCMLEEAAEVAASIRIYQKTGNHKNLCEELGDVLLQVLLHSQIASEEGRFTLDDVIQAICEKMIRRHPHVFGTKKAGTASEVLSNWEAIKKEEKASQEWVRSELLDIPVELPALMRAQKVIKKVDKQTLEKKSFSEEKQEIRGILRELTGENIEEENRLRVGNLFYLISGLANKLHIDAEQALMEQIDNRIEEAEIKKRKTP